MTEGHEEQSGNAEETLQVDGTKLDGRRKSRSAMPKSTEPRTALHKNGADAFPIE